MDSFGLDEADVARLRAGLGARMDLGEPLFKLDLTFTQKQQLRVAISAWIAIDGLPQNTAEKEGCVMFFKMLGYDVLPCHQTVKKYTGLLAQDSLDELRALCKALVCFSPLKVVSLCIDGFKTDDGSRRPMSLLLCFFNPVTLESNVFAVPLAVTRKGTVDVSGELDMVQQALMNATGLKMSNVYFATSDTVSRRPFFSLDVIPVPCASLRVELVVDKAFGKFSSALDGEEVEVEVEVEVEKEEEEEDEEDDDEEYDEEEEEVLSACPKLVQACVQRVRARAAVASESGPVADGVKALLAAKSAPSTGYTVYCPTSWMDFLDAAIQDEQLQTLGVGAAFEPSLQGTPEELEHERMLIYMLMPVGRLALFLKRAENSLGDALLEIVDTHRLLMGNAIAHHLDLHSEPGEGAQHTELGALPQDLQDFYQNLRLKFEEHLLAFSDTSVISVMMSPSLTYQLRLLATVSPTAKSILDRFAYVRPMIVEKMVQVAAVTYKHQATSTSTTAAAAASTPTATSGRSRKMLILNLESASSNESLEDKMTRELADFEDTRALEHHSDMTDIDFFKRYRDSYPHVFHVFVQVRGVRPSSAAMEARFSRNGVQVPQSSRSAKLGTLDDIMVVQTLLTNRKQINEVAARSLKSKRA